MRPKAKSIPLDQMLKPSEVEQQTALWTAISEMLWNVGERQKVIVVLPGDVPHIQHSHTYFQDSVTEKLYLFEFVSREELQIFIKRYLYYVSLRVDLSLYFKKSNILVYGRSRTRSFVTSVQCNFHSRSWQVRFFFHF